jgi:hypothetical protein
LNSDVSPVVLSGRTLREYTANAAAIMQAIGSKRPNRARRRAAADFSRSFLLLRARESSVSARDGAGISDTRSITDFTRDSGGEASVSATASVTSS